MIPFDALMQDELGFAPDAYGYDTVGFGWFSIIRKLVKDLDALGWSERRVDQIKEKFGGLRFVASVDTKAMADLIWDAEAESFKICEDCGASGSPEMRGGWIRTQCKACRAV